MAASLYLERRYQQVIEESRRIVELDPTFVTVYFNLGRAYTQMKRHREAIAELKKARDLSGESPAMTMQLGYAYAMAGKAAEARKMLAALARLARKRYVPAFYWVAIHTGLGDIQKALQYLKKARDERCDYLVYLPKEPAADPIRDTPEFARLVPRAASLDQKPGPSHFRQLSPFRFRWSTPPDIDPNQSFPPADARSLHPSRIARSILADY